MSGVGLSKIDDGLVVFLQFDAPYPVLDKITRFL